MNFDTKLAIIRLT